VRKDIAKARRHSNNFRAKARLARASRLQDRDSPRDDAKTVSNATTNHSIIAFSDCRSQDLDLFRRWVRGLPYVPDLIVYAGDDCTRFRPNAHTNYFELFADQSRFGLVAVIGNDDKPKARSLIRGKNVYEVHSSPIRLGPAFVMGLEGAPIPSSPDQGWGIGPTLHSERKVAQHLQSALTNRDAHHVLIVSHAPPSGILDLAMRFGQHHIGSTALRSMIEQHENIELVICGHVHREGGRVKLLNNTCVINVASHDGFSDPLRVAEIKWPIGLPSHLLDSSIKWHLLYPNGNLQSIPGIGPQLAARLQSVGLDSVESLACAEEEMVAGAVGWKTEAVSRFISRAKARLQQSPVLVRSLPAYARPRIFFDIETDPQFGSKYVWLIGCLNESTGEFQQFLSRTPKNEASMLRSFAEYCTAFASSQMLSYSGTRFDRNKTIARMRAHNIAVPYLLDKSIDIHRDVASSIALHTFTYKLKEVASVFGFSYRHPELDGWEVALDYERAWRSKREIPQELLEYNEDDVRSLAHLVKSLEKFRSSYQRTEL
jgi:Icc-related predicted phosphoesterase/uncharacterized protein YprB with RNaseH-like and TPR domain